LTAFIEFFDFKAFLIGDLDGILGFLVIDVFGFPGATDQGREFIFFVVGQQFDAADFFQVHPDGIVDFDGDGGIILLFKHQLFFDFFGVIEVDQFVFGDIFVGQFVQIDEIVFLFFGFGASDRFGRIRLGIQIFESIIQGRKITDHIDIDAIGFQRDHQIVE